MSDLLPLILQAGGEAADLPFWEGCRQGRLLVHRCGLCDRHYWPASRCIEHGDTAMDWVDAGGKGTLYTYTILHRAYIPAMRDQVPYVVAVVKLAEGPFFHTNLIDCDADRIEIGMALEAVMVDHHSGLTCPMFRPAAS